MLRGAAILLGFQFAGEAVSLGLGAPVSGAICGMALLLLWLMISGRVPEDLATSADGLLAIMPILFVPVAVGAVVYADLFQRHWPAVVCGVAGATLLTLITTALTVRFTTKSSDPQDRPIPQDPTAIRR
jgi:holin-like protein